MSYVGIKHFLFNVAVDLGLSYFERREILKLID